MKSKFLLVIATVAVAFTACTKDDNKGIQLQEHDQNAMMDSMHG